MGEKNKKQKFYFFNKFGSTLGVLTILISVYPGYHISEFSRPILMYIVPLINKILLFFPKLFLGIEYGWFEFIAETFIIFGGTGFIYSFIAIFVPILVFSKWIKKDINWKPAIYVLFFWLAFVEYKSNVKILSQDVGDLNRFIYLLLPVIFHGVGLFGTLFFAYSHIEEKSTSKNF